MKNLFLIALVLLVVSTHAQVSPAPPATQAEVNSGVIHNKFVAPDTLAGRLGGTNGFTGNGGSLTNVSIAGIQNGGNIITNNAQFPPLAGITITNLSQQYALTIGVYSNSAIDPSGLPYLYLPTGDYYGQNFLSIGNITAGGNFSGNGSGITGINAANVSGTFTGNGGGLTSTTNLPGNSSWALSNSNLVLNSTNFTITPSTNIVITGAGAAQVNGTYLGFYPSITNSANSAVATLANGQYIVSGPGYDINGYPMEIDDVGFGTNYYYSTNGITWYSTSSAYNPPPSGAINYSGFATNFTVLPVSIPGLHNYIIWNFGAKGGTNDDTAAFIAAAQSGQIVNLDPGTNYTISRLTLPSGANIDGHGAKVVFSAGLTGYAITCTNNGNHTIFKNVILDGGLPANWSFVGSNVVSAYTNVWRSGFLLGAEMPFSDFSGCVAQNLQDRGFTFVGNLGQFPQPTSSSTVLNGIQAYSDWVGAEFVNSAEYVVANSWQIKNCGHALHIFSGNDQLTGVNFTRNGIAVYITGASYTDPNGVTNDNYSVANAAHGVLSGCLNHNGYAAWLSEFNQGFAFNNVTIQGANTLNNIVMMTNVTGVTILGGQPGTSQIIVNGSDSNSGDNYYNWQGLSNYPSVFTYGTGKLHVISGAISELNSVIFSNGIVTATSFIGSGSGLTNLPASQLTGTLPQSTLPAGVLTNNLASFTVVTNGLYWIFNPSTNYQLWVGTNNFNVGTPIMAISNNYVSFGQIPNSAATSAYGGINAQALALSATMYDSQGFASSGAANGGLLAGDGKGGWLIRNGANVSSPTNNLALGGVLNASNGVATFTSKIPGAVTVGSSAFNFTNNGVSALQCCFADAAVYSVALNGISVFPSVTGGCSLVLQSTNVCTITYLSTTPTFYTNNW